MRTYLQYLDIFDKSTNDDFKLDTKSSAILSTILTAIGATIVSIHILGLIQPKFARYLNLEIQSLDQQELANVSLDVQVNMPCYFLHLDVVDNLGFNQLDINTTAKFHRLDVKGNELGLANETLSTTCHSCYGLLPEGSCCNSCEQTIILHLMNNRAVNAKDLPQCQGKNPGKVYVNEKCKIKGKVCLNKASGNFHIAPGANMKGRNGHFHDLSVNLPNYDLSHTITNMRVGPKIPLTFNPLRYHKQTQNPNQPIAYRYDLVVTPAIYKSGNKVLGRGYDYTAMINRFFVHGGGAPGIFFHYSFTPYGVTVNATYLTIAQMFSSTFGFIAGLYALFSIIDETFFSAAKGQSTAKPEQKPKGEKKPEEK